MSKNQKENTRVNSELDVSTSVDHVRILYNHRAILLIEKSENKRYLLVSDLHIGFEEKFRGAGIALETKIDNLSDELKDVIQREKVTDLLINGDVKSGTDRITKSEWDNVPRFFERMIELCHVSVIPGNHDGGLFHLIPPDVTILDSNGIMISNNLILHGHTRPLTKFQNCRQLIMGHVHPIFQKRGSPLSGQPVWVFLKVERKQIFKELLQDQEAANTDSKKADVQEEASKQLRVILMPSFNLELVVGGYAQDAARQERKIAPILRDLNENISEAVVTTLDGELIGDASLISNIL